MAERALQTDGPAGPKAGYRKALVVQRIKGPMRWSGEGRNETRKGRLTLEVFFFESL